MPAPTTLSPSFPSGAKTAIWAALAAAASVCLAYTMLLGLGSVEFFQRHFLYAHKLHTAWMHDLGNPPLWGFARNQVRPFMIRNSEGDGIYAWHILPHSAYVGSEAEEWNEPALGLDDFLKSLSFESLAKSPVSKLVLYFHGNAGHLAQKDRPGFYRLISGIDDCHIIAIDYRGFGLSSRVSGGPSEASLLSDSFAVIDWVLHTVSIPASRIVLVGHSLGTAVVAGAAAKYVDQEVEFAGLVLVAGFSRLSTMLARYRIGGLFPVLGPVRHFPFLLRWFQSFIVDDWDSAARLEQVIRRTRRRARLTLIHALDDWDIPAAESRALFDTTAAAAAERHSPQERSRAHEAELGDRDGSYIIKRSLQDPSVVLRLEVAPKGGHNRIIRLPTVAMAVQRCFSS